MDISVLFQRLGVALGLGLLVGLQRERAKPHLGGLRTLPLVTIFGTVCGFLAQSFGGWVVAAGLVAIAALLVLGNVLREEYDDAGITTEAAFLLMFGVGAYLAVGEIAVAVAVGGGAAVLLEFKGQIHGVAERLSDRDVTAVMRFALLSLVILPALPDATYGPYGVFNPRNTWVLVVLIVGISLAGYIVYKFFGETAGTVFGGVLGGVISSTATTVSYAKRSAGTKGADRAAAIVIAIASTVVYVRVLVEIGAVAPGFLAVAAPPLLIQMAAMAAVALVLWFRSEGEEAQMPDQGSPSELKSALVFGAIYVVVLFAVAATMQYLGTKGLYVVAGISGLTDVDAITLSTAQLVGAGRVEQGVGWRVITVGVISNLVFKAGIVAMLGSRKAFFLVSVAFGVAAATAAALLALWPDWVPQLGFLES